MSGSFQVNCTAGLYVGNSVESHGESLRMLPCGHRFDSGSSPKASSPSADLVMYRLNMFVFVFELATLTVSELRHQWHFVY
jgi:hypothetical protein